MFNAFEYVAVYRLENLMMEREGIGINMNI